jgi:hypothetical protein
MAVKPPQFKLEQLVMMAGQPFRVSGMLQFELADGAVATRYLLEGEKGLGQILEERPGRLALLRQFPQTAAPDPSGREISVMGMRYALAGVDKLKILGAEGSPVGAAPSEGLLLSGRFESDAGLILREIAPGGGAVQTFYAVKPVAEGDVITVEQHLKILEAQREIAEQQASALAETGGSSSGWGVKLAGWTVSIIVIVVLVYACSSDDESSSSSARTGSVHYGGSGGK